LEVPALERECLLEGDGKEACFWGDLFWSMISQDWRGSGLRFVEKTGRLAWSGKIRAALSAMPGNREWFGVSGGEGERKKLCR